MSASLKSLLELPTMMSPPTVAKFLGTNVDKIGSWVASGALRATNVAANPDGVRPRWRIAREDLQEFLAKRSNKPTPAPVHRTHRRKGAATITEFV